VAEGVAVGKRHSVLVFAAQKGKEKKEKRAGAANSA